MQVVAAPRPQPRGNASVSASAVTTVRRYRALRGAYQKGIHAPNADPRVFWNLVGSYACYS